MSVLTAARSRGLTWPVMALIVAAGLILFSVVRAISGANDIDSSGTVEAAIRAAVPIALAGLGGLWA